MLVKGRSDECFLSSSIHINTDVVDLPVENPTAAKSAMSFSCPACGCDFAAEHMGATHTSPPIPLGPSPFWLNGAKPRLPSASL